MSCVFQVDNVSFRRGDTTILEQVSLEIHAGEVLALVGPNGAGKSTLLNLLAADTTPDTGEIHLHGRPLTTWSLADLSRLRAVLPQQTLLQFGFEAQEVVAMGRLPLPPGSPADEERAISRAMTLTDTLPLRHRVYPKLSGGEQSRVSLSRVRAQETPVILLDEPTASLDIRHQHDVMGIARDIARQGGTVIAILHDLNLAMSYADRIGLLHQGRLVTCGAPWEIAREDLLEEVFACRVAITQHPVGAQPLVVPLGAHVESAFAPVGMTS